MILTKEKKGSIVCFSLQLNISDETFEILQGSKFFDQYQFTIEDKERFFNFNIEIPPSIGVRTMLLLQDDFSKCQKKIPQDLTSKIKELAKKKEEKGLSEDEIAILEKELNVLNSDLLSNLTNELFMILSKGDKIEELFELFFNNKTLTNLMYGETLLSLNYQEKVKIYIDCIEIALYLNEIVSSEQKKK